MKANKPEFDKKISRFSAFVFPIFVLLGNTIYCGADYFSSVKIFLLFSVITTTFFIPHSLVARRIGMYCFGKWPGDVNLKKRLVISIFIKTIFSLLVLYVAVMIPDWISLYPFNREHFMWTFLAQAIINIFMTFMAEGFLQFSEWEKNHTETIELNNAYKISQLHGLKSQVNPHFLFNSLNSLSSLIEEDEEAAEKFLDEMSKVYRYMLRNDDEHLVTLETELQFTASYMHLLKARYGDGLQLLLSITENDKGKLLAPLTLQVIIENAFSQNSISKTSPLIISITSDGKGNLVMKNNLQRKAIMDAMDFEAGLDNLVKKYELLNLPITVDDSDSRNRVIQLSLLAKQKEAAV